MEIKNFTITKRDGSKDRFSLDKIMNAIVKAFESVNVPADLSTLSKILSHLDMHDDIKVEDIQNQVEEALMREGYYQVAKSFMLYRQAHSEDRETLAKLQFLSDYVESVNAATGSKYDANANVEHKNIATLIGELPKSSFIRLNRRLLTDRIKKMYGKQLADEYIDKLTHHFIYKNDETSLANYCASITMYPWLIGGTIDIGGNSTAPTNLKSYCGGFVNMVFMVSSMLSGACATPEFLMYMNYFIGKEFGLDYWQRADEVVDLSLSIVRWTRSSPTTSSRLSIPSTNRLVPVTTRQCSGTWPIMTAITSKVYLESSTSPMVPNPTGTVSAGFRSVS